jgi:hypothetical protein
VVSVAVYWCRVRAQPGVLHAQQGEGGTVKEYIIEYVVCQTRLVRLEASSREVAEQEVKEWHDQMTTDKLKEVVVIQRIEEDV